MASVSRCDSCGKIVKHEDCTFIKMFEENPSGRIGKMITTLEICTSCSTKFLKEFDSYGSEQR